MGSLKILIVASLIGIACTTKVSEWVLLNITPEQYLLVHYHKSQIPEIVMKENEALTMAVKGANIQFRSVVKEAAATSYYALYYRNRLYAEFTDNRELAGLTVSPLREKIAAEIMSGKLCIMLFLRSGDPEKDDARFSILSETVAGSPFKRVITVVDLDRDDLFEKHFISMLLNVESDLKDISEPMLFGIFGRFRVLEPLVGKGITGENINLMTDFLTADCSCLIKDDLPGADILFTENWENPMPALVNRILDENPSLMHH